MIVKLKCRVCGTEFRSERLNQLYCSDACRKQGRKEYFKSRYENNKEQLNEQSKIWRENHREYIKIKQREWNKKNSDYGTNRSRKIRGSKEYARECIVCGKAFTTWFPQKKTCSDECKTIHKKEYKKEHDKGRKLTSEEQHAKWIRRRYGSEENYQKWLVEQEALKQELRQQREQDQLARKEAYENQLEAWRVAREAKKEANLRKDFCIVCGKEYETYNPAQKTCSKECGKRLKHAHKHKRIPKSQLVDKDITLEALYKRDFGVCYLCGKPCDWNDKKDMIVGPTYPSIDHMIPVSRGGLHAWTNVKLAHFECNWKKSDALLPSTSSTVLP